MLLLLLLQALFFVRHFWAGNKMANVCLPAINNESERPQKVCYTFAFLSCTHRKTTTTAAATEATTTATAGTVTKIKEVSNGSGWEYRSKGKGEPGIDGQERIGGCQQAT